MSALLQQQNGKRRSVFGISKNQPYRRKDTFQSRKFIPYEFWVVTLEIPWTSDGASNMAGRHNGLQAKVLAENRVVQKLLRVVHPIHTMCQGQRVTTGDVRRWVNTTTLSPSANANMIVIL